MTPQNNIPADMDALLAWLKEQALEAHNTWCDDCQFLNDCQILEDEVRDDILCALDAQEKAYNRVIAKIENSRVNQRPHVPAGWDEV